jgi:hypothetical protein
MQRANAIRRATGLLCLVLLCAGASAKAPPSRLPILDGESKLLLINGYSTSFHWPEILQRKLERHAGGAGPIAVVPVTLGKSPIARWIDVETGKPREPWARLRQALAGKGDRPAIVLAQQSLQWVFGERREGIRDEQDADRIAQGADALQTYAERLLADGADLVFIATHIYKRPMEPAIGNERLALAQLMERRLPGVYAGPDVWEPTRRHFPEAFAEDKVHPNTLGAEILAQAWFEALLAHDGLPVPAWSRQELAAAVAAAGD